MHTMFSFLGYEPNMLGVVKVEALPTGILQEPKATSMYKYEKTDFFLPPLLFLLSFRSDDTSQRAFSPLNSLHSRRVENGVEHHFLGLFQKIHRPPEYPKAL
jgi:hypothetical protein